MLESSWVAEQSAASQEELSSMKVGAKKKKLIKETEVPRWLCSRKYTSLLIYNAISTNPMWVLSYGIWNGLVLHKYIDVSEDRITSTFDSENWGCNFLQNVTEHLPNYTASQPIRLCPNGHCCENLQSNKNPYTPDSSVGIATCYGLDGRGIGVRVPVEARFFASPRRPDRFWGPPSLLSNMHRRLFTRG
jgi:hypothetical protein